MSCTPQLQDEVAQLLLPPTYAEHCSAGLPPRQSAAAQQLGCAGKAQKAASLISKGMELGAQPRR